MQLRLRFITDKGVHSDSQLSYLFLHHFGLDNGSTLVYDSAYECTESYHQYYIQNNSNLELKFNFEFSHKVYQILSNGQEQFVDDDTIDQSAPPGADTLDNGEDDINWWWNMVDMSGRSGPHRIKAYTQLRVRRVHQGTETDLFSTPKASEVYDFSI